MRPWLRRIALAIVALATVAASAVLALPRMLRVAKRPALAAGADPVPVAAGDRDAIRGALAEVYRGAAYSPPPRVRQVFVASPLAGALAAGLATGVWWLRAHPEAHRELFGGPVGEEELGRALDRACEHAVQRGAAALSVDDGVAAIAPLIASTRAAARRAITASPLPTAVWPDVEASGTAHDRASLEAVAIERAVERGGWSTVAPGPGHAVAEADRAIEIVIGAATATAVPGDAVASFLLEGLPWWWHTRGPIRRELVAVAVHAGSRFLHPAFWIVSERPSAVHRDERQRLHRERAPAIAWRDGWGLYYLRGIAVPARVAGGDVTTDEIRDVGNTELRRVLVEIYDRSEPGRYLRDAGAIEIDRDVDALGHPRRLLQLDDDGDDEPYVAIEVTNATPELDGSHEQYVLRVPPGTTTCRAAIAWTFGMTADEYAPEFET